MLQRIALLSLAVLAALTLVSAFVPGEIQMKWGHYRREDNPIVYWFSVAALSAITAGLLVASIACAF